MTPRVWLRPVASNASSSCSCLVRVLAACAAGAACAAVDGVWSADGELLRVTLRGDDQYRLWVPLSEISPTLVDAILLKEDRWFYWHPGVNPVALIRGGVPDVIGRRSPGRVDADDAAGATALRLEHTDAGRQARQIGAALWLEARYSKRELLEAYLNVAPFGGNIQGVGAASRIYFGKSPDRLTLGESLTLAVIPQRPADGRAGRVGSRAARRARAARTKPGWRVRRRHAEAERRQIELPIVARPDTRCRGRRRISWTRCSPVAAMARRPHRHHLDAGLQRLRRTQIQRYLAAARRSRHAQRGGGARGYARHGV